MIVTTYFFMACLVLNVCSFCVAGDMISSEGETYCCVLFKFSLVFARNSFQSGTYGSLPIRDCRTWRWYSRLLGLPSFSGEGVGLSCMLVSRTLRTLAVILACVFMMFW